MTELILWIVFATSGTCGGFQKTIIEITENRPVAIERAEIGAWQKAIEFTSRNPCAGVTVKRYIAVEDQVKK